MTAFARIVRSSSIITALVFVSSAFACPASTKPGSKPDSDHTALAVPPKDRLEAVFPGFKLTRELAEPFPLFTVHDTGDALLGYIADSDHAGTTAEGYVGPVPVLAYLGPDGGILDFDVLGNRETPGYLAIALGPDFRKRMKTYQSGQEEPVDAVSLATISSAAILEGLTGLVDRIDRELINPAEAP